LYFAGVRTILQGQTVVPSDDHDMTRLLERRSPCWLMPLPARPRRAVSSGIGGGWRGVIWALLATGLVFCHGCHRDEDNELCIVSPPRASQTHEKTAP
jgi:hypothetical protein